jgi:hypothetical protein
MASGKQVIMRIGEPYALKDKGKQSSIKGTVITSESAYFLDKEDLVFSGLLIDYEDFLNNPDDPDILYEYVHCFSWRLVQDIDSPIYIRDTLEGEGFQEEKWSDIGQSELASLDMVLRLWDAEGYGGDSLLSVFREHWKKIRRDFVIGKIIEDGDK